PLLKRIKLLDPQFNPSEFADIAKAWSQPVQSADSEGAEVSIAGFAPAVAIPARRPAAAPATPAPATLPQADARVAVSARGVVDQMAEPGSHDFRAAATIRTTMSSRLRSFAHMAERAPQVIYALTLDAAPDVRARQLRIVEKHHDAAFRAQVE